MCEMHHFTRYPDATAEDLATTDSICIICREDMVAGEPGAGGGGTCKKLPCNHIFHSSCLRSWFQRQQTCPTCRMDVLRLSVAAASQRLRQQGQQQQGGVGQQGQAGPGLGQQGNGQVPPVPGQGMLYSCFAGNHVEIIWLCFQSDSAIATHYYKR